MIEYVLKPVSAKKLRRYIQYDLNIFLSLFYKPRYYFKD